MANSVSTGAMSSSGSNGSSGGKATRRKSKSKSSSGFSNMGGGIGGISDRTGTRQVVQPSNFSAANISNMGGLQGGAMEQQMLNFNKQARRAAATKDINEIAQSLNQLPARDFAFEPISDQRRYLEGQLEGLNQLEAGKFANDPNATLETQTEAAPITADEQGNPIIESLKNALFGGLNSGIDPATGETMPVLGGSVPIGPASGIGIIKSIGSKINAARKAKSAAKVAQALGISEIKATSIINAGLRKQSVTTAVKALDAGKFAGISGKQIAGAAGTIAGADVMFQWYALDNVISGQKFYVSDIVAGVQRGEIQQKEAIDAIQKSREVRELAINKVKLSATINPLMYPARKLILAGVDADELAIKLKEQQLGL